MSAIATSTATAWTDVQPGIEYEAANPLIGWRVSVILVNGIISPFVNGPTATAVCGVEPAERHHTGREVHPECRCGLYLIDTRQHLVDYWIDGGRRLLEGRAKIGRHRLAGLAICQVETTANITGYAYHPGMIPPDTEHCYRTNELRLRRVFIPTGNRSGLPDRIGRKYPEIPVAQMRGPMHTIASAKYAEADR